MIVYGRSMGLAVRSGLKSSAVTNAYAAFGSAIDNSPNTIEPLKGYWVYVTEDVEVQINLN
jgi:hypothetical protein